MQNPCRFIQAVGAAHQSHITTTVTTTVVHGGTGPQMPGLQGSGSGHHQGALVRQEVSTHTGPVPDSESKILVSTITNGSVCMVSNTICGVFLSP